MKENNPHWTEILDNLFRILIARGSESRKTNTLFNLISKQPDIEKICLYSNNPYEANNQLLNNKRESTGLKDFNDFKAFIEYLNNMNNIYKKIEENNPNKKHKIFIALYDMIVDTHSNRKSNRIVTKLFIRGRKLNVPLVFIMQSYFMVLKDVRHNTTHYFKIKIPNKRELEQMLTMKML